MSGQILTIGLAEEVNDAFRQSFAHDQMHVIECGELDEATALFSMANYRLILYDASALSLNDVQETVSKIRSATYAPLIVLSADDVAAAAQEAGADICIQPSVDLQRLFSTAMGQIRRNECYSKHDAAGVDTTVLYRGDLIIDLTRHYVAQAGKEIRLLPREFRLLEHFGRNPGIVLTPKQLATVIWGLDHNYRRDAAKVVSDLRRKLGDSRENPIYIETIHGVGYRFIPHE